MNKVYEWSGINRQGQRVQGKESTVSLQTLYQQLQQRGISVLKTKKQYLFITTKSQKISAKQLAEFTRQIAMLCQANIDLINALEIVIQDNNTSLENLIHSIKKNIENGKSFAEALQNHPQYFDKIYCGLIQAGEQSGTLEKMLIQLADYQDHMLNLRAKIAKALFYPMTVAVAATLITSGLLIFVVPQFKTIFNSFGAQLPLFTQLIIKISSLMQAHIIKFMVCLTALIVGYRYCERRFSWLAAGRDNLLLKLPVIGQLQLLAIFSRWTRILATLLTARLSLVDALRIAAQTIPNRSMQKVMQQIIQQVSAGGTFYQALSAHPYFPRRITQMITVGENAGQLALMLDKIADMQQEMLDRRIDYFSKWLEPAIMMILAVVTGSLIIAMYLPVFKLGAAM